jgi:tRNA-specific 2-thiouridylase
MKTVYVGLSGGVDSSVSAALLQEQGYRVVGVYMKNWTQDIGGVACPWAEDLADARAAAAVLDIPFKIFDFQDEYRQRVVDVMVAEYESGRTPNPDVLCNEDIKFKLFLETALADGADLIATGHYARTKDGQLLMGHDHHKDQTYFLYRVTKEALGKTLFPVGELEKPEVRRLAEKFRLPTATKPDSQGICFVGEVGIKAFLEDRVEAVPGPVMLGDTVVGEHDGAIFYTIGQRHGLGIGGGKPFYVTGKDMKTNTVYVTDDPNDLSLERDEFGLQDLHWIGAAPEVGKTYKVRIRHGGRLTAGVLEKGSRIRLTKPERAVAVGQSAVLYDGDLCLGGGIID